MRQVGVNECTTVRASKQALPRTCFHAKRCFANALSPLKAEKSRCRVKGAGELCSPVCRVSPFDGDSRRISLLIPSIVQPLRTLHCCMGAAALSLALLLSPGPAQANEVLQGQPRFADGDTLEIAGARVRVYGVDAPELKQVCKDSNGQDFQCGRFVLDAVKNWVGNSSVTCTVKNKDQYGRSVSSCDISGKGDLGAWLVSNGYGVAYRQYSKEYIPAEDAARAAHKGLWQGQFEEPAQWRKEAKLAQLTASTGGSLAPAPLPVQAVGVDSREPPNPSCPIKGNINKGKKLYHVPGTAYYNSVKIDESAGERWFCSAEEAEPLGWLPAR